MYVNFIKTYMFRTIIHMLEYTFQECYDELQQNKANSCLFYNILGNDLVLYVDKY